MSTSYYVYVEAKVGNKWISIDPYIPQLIDKRKDYKEPHQYNGDYELKHAETYWNGSRSYFGQTYDKLRDIGTTIAFADLSDDVKKEWKGSVEDEAKDDDGWQWYKPIQVDYKTFLKYVHPKQFDSHGMVHKDIIFQYENDELEDMYAIDHEEYVALTPEEKASYTYHEWDDAMGWNTHFKILAECIGQRVSDFKALNWLHDDCDISYRIVVIAS